jgi:D-xylulose reductase
MRSVETEGDPLRDGERGAAPMTHRHRGTVRASALVMHAEQRPMPGIDRPGPHQRYRAPVLRLEERTLGAVPTAHVRVRVALAGVCGTDLNAVTTDPQTGYIVGSAPLDLDERGRVLGHEGIGEILDVARDVTGVRPGEWVGFESILSCGQCAPCQGGHPNQCTVAVLLGTQRDGLFATVADVPARLAHPLGTVAETEDGRRAAACLEPAACSLLALRLAHVKPGDAVLIFGAGPIGAAAAMLARVVLGAGRVRVVEPLPLRRELVRRWADATFDIEDFFGAGAREPADVLIETSGDLDNVRRALPAIAPNGRVALLARSGAPLTIEHVDHMITRNVTLFGCRGHLGGPVPEVLELVRCGRLPLHELVTGVLPSLAALADALRAPRAVMARHCKVLVSP